MRVILLQDANTRVVLLGACALGIAAGAVGCFAVLRKRSLMGDAVAHAALPGVCAAYFVVGERNFPALLLGALVFGVIASAFVTFVKSFTRIKEDAAIAMAIGGFFGLGIVLSRLIQNQPGGNRAGLDGFIFGKAASMVRSDALTIALVALGVLGVIAVCYKEFKVLCFDRAFAAGMGLPTLALDLLLMVLVCVCTVVGLPAVGVVLMVALLVIPPVAARFWTESLGATVLLSSVFGGASGLLGTVLSATLPSPDGALSRGWPTGPLIVLVAAAMFACSMLASPRRGLLADGLRRWSLRRRIAMQNLLRDVYESLEARGEFAGIWRAEAVARDGRFAPSVVHRALREHLIAPGPGGFVLTSDGLRAASRVVRAHRLWERYLIEQAEIAADHVDRDADEIEHILPARLIEQLEARLAEEGRLPGVVALTTVPESPHPIASAGSGRFKAMGMIAVLALVGLAARPALAERSMASIASIAPAGDAAWFHVGSYEVRSDDLWTAGTAVLCSVACAVIGCFLVLRRLSLLGDAISHAILPGLAVAFMLTQSRSPSAMVAGALAVGVMTALLSGGLSRWGKVPEDASMGVVFTTLFAVGVILISFTARDIDLDPGCVLYGLIEFVPFDTVRLGGFEVPRAFAWLGAALALNVGLIVAFYKELKIVCFDPELATSMGISAAVVHYGLMSAVAGTCVASFEAVGSILVIAMLVAPGATAHLLTDRLSRMLTLSAVIAAACAVSGYAAAVWLNTSVAGMIATLALLVFILTAIGSPRYGVVGRVLARSRVRTMETMP